MEAIIAKLEAETEDKEWAQTTLKVQTGMHVFVVLFCLVLSCSRLCDVEFA